MSRIRLFKRWKIMAALVVAVLASAFVGTEFIYYYPLTPLSLDTDGSTRLPEAEDRVRLLFVGDILLGDAAASYLEDKGLDHPFGATRSLIERADLAIGNLEGPIAPESTAPGRKRWEYNMKREAAAALSRAGFDLVSLANNHVGDRGDTGIVETRRNLEDAGIRFFGAGLAEQEAHRAAIEEVGGVTIAFLGYQTPYVLQGGGSLDLHRVWVGPNGAGAAGADIEKIRGDIARVREDDSVDLVLVSIHMGGRYQEAPHDFERELAHGVIDAGADAVIGHGSHIMGPIERYNGKPILYSVGNFAFGSINAYARFSLMAFLEVDRTTKSIVAVQALPIYTMNASLFVWFQPKVLTGYRAGRVLRELVDRSRPLNGALVIEGSPDRATMAL